MTSLWLTKKKKGELIALCEHLGLEVDGYLKLDLENILAEYLEAHENELSHDSLLSPYYDTIIGPRSPIKSSTVLQDLPEKRIRRRTSRYVDGTSNSFDRRFTEESTPEPFSMERKTRSGSRPHTGHTPRTMRSVRASAHAPLPPSPGDVADEFESRTEQIKYSVLKTIEDVQIKRDLVAIRNRLSNVVSINAIVLTLEIYLLFLHIIPSSYNVVIPAIGILGTSAISFNLPDLFTVLTSNFWFAVFAWSATSLVGPVICAMIFNLISTTEAVRDGAEYQIDPLSFAVTKALLVYLVHHKGYSFFGILGTDPVETVAKSLGKELPLITAMVAAIAAIWEGILRR